jgi:hypothetical protein
VHFGRCAERRDGSFISSDPILVQNFFRQEGFSSGDRAVSTADLVRRFGDWPRNGFFLLIRPHFNELRIAHEPSRSGGFRDFRSFDGEPLKEVRFYSPGVKERDVVVVDDPLNVVER